MALTRDELLSQALLGVAVIERIMVPERGALADESLEIIRENGTQYEDLKEMYLQLLYAATMLTAYGADSANIEVSELLDRVRGNMLAARLTASDDPS